MKSVLRRLLLLLTLYVAESCFPKKLEPLAHSTDPASILDVTVEAVYATIATLRFLVDNTAAVTEYGYVYSTNRSDPTHTNSSGIQSVGSSLSTSAVTASLINLKPKTGYFIAPFVKDSEGYKYGQAVRVDTRSSSDLLKDAGNTSTGPPTSARGFIHVFSTVFMINDDIYAITNDRQPGYGYAAMQAFNLSNKQWRSVSFPAAAFNGRTDATALVHTNRAYVGFGTGNATDLYSYQPDRWESIRSPNSNPSIPAFQAIGGIGYSYNDKVYAWNGTWMANNNTQILWNDGTYGKVTPSDHIPFWEYNQGTGSWNLVKAKVTNDFFATLRQSPFYFVIEDRLYLGGGENLHDPQRRSEIWELNLKTLEVRSVARLPDSFVYQDPNLSNGNHRNLAAGLQGAGWKRGYILDVHGNLFMMDVTDANNVKISNTGQRPGGTGVLVSNGKRLFFLQTGQNQQILELFP